MNDTDIVERERNKRVADRWSELCVVGSHDFYKALFQIVREECERLRSGRAAVWAECREECAKVADAWCEKNHHPNGAWGIAAGIRALTGGPRD